MGSVGMLLMNVLYILVLLFDGYGGDGLLYYIGGLCIYEYV